MEKTKVLFVSQEITPYLPETEMSHIGRYLPQGIQETGKEIRTFMPRYGLINERRNQLHEVIRLSGMNLIIDDSDHPLIIKVASIQSARMQVYFIDNEDYFQRKAMFTDENNQIFDDNDERTIFFSRGVIETVEKLRWAPDIIHCHGWISSLIPLYIKKSLKDNPLFCDSKVVYSVYNDDFEGKFHRSFKEKLKIDGIENEDITILKRGDYVNLNKSAIDNSDAIIYGSEKVNLKLKRYIDKQSVPVLPYQTNETFLKAYSQFYDKLLENQKDE
ncbi:MAG: glycogen/starch synthase [Bacteroidetes bacterium]|jgi:starch synthase|nr:glycogen/starch synthase [Bacteroidota bacterium]MBT6686816.1 glycogen/starch synthase [Bacteroidota bacterium]MBT7144146.1 glycogen/starch synthase [Bacteroidota bacterium]MBT7490082.1 glycogen/starch synthase [Bacteroidota bacterium]